MEFLINAIKTVNRVIETAVNVIEVVASVIKYVKNFIKPLLGGHFYMKGLR